MNSFGRYAGGGHRLPPHPLRTAQLETDSGDGNRGHQDSLTELNHLPLLRDAAHWKQEKEDRFVILSSGVSHLGDIEEALTCFPNRENLTLLHCITAYPAPAEEYNLALIPLYKALFGCASGVSDHSTIPFSYP